MRRDYAANGGWETFLSYEDPAQDLLIGLLRLRKVGAVLVWQEQRACVLRCRVTLPDLMHALRYPDAHRAGIGTDRALHSRTSNLHPFGQVTGTERQPELQGRCSIVRELHVYGTAVAVHARDASKYQHQGYGSLLMAEAERIAIEEHGSERLAVISGVGTRHYYRKLGYELLGPYMAKNLVPRKPSAPDWDWLE